MAKQSTNRSRVRGLRPTVRAVVPDTLTQVRALSHPLRLRLLELFAERPRTTMQAAEALDEAPTRLYHHVATLERAGLVRLRETRPNRGTIEKYFEAVAREATDANLTSALLANKRGRRGLSAAAVLLFDQARNELVRALAASDDRPPETMMAVRAVLHLSPAKSSQLVRDLAKLMRRSVRRRPAHEQDPPDLGQPPVRDNRKRYSLTIALLPIAAEASRSSSHTRSRKRRAIPRVGEPPASR
jgi:DNA-binding transcriptional ArsR family regulator